MLVRSQLSAFLCVVLMMKRVSEVQLMTVILLFVVFAFLMQGRAHVVEYKSAGREGR